MSVDISICYICEQNISRSAAAEYLTRSRIEEGEGISVDSAGIRDASVNRMTSWMKRALYHGQDGTIIHTPKKVTLEFLSEQDLVLCMQKRQLRYLQKNYGLDGRVHLLSEYATGRRRDIHDADKFIKKEPMSLRGKLWFPFSRKVHYMDADAIDALHCELVNELDQYVVQVLERVRNGRV